LQIEDRAEKKVRLRKRKICTSAETMEKTSTRDFKPNPPVAEGQPYNKIKKKDKIGRNIITCKGI